MKKLTDIIKNSKKTLFSFEILPPLKGKNIDCIYQNINPLMEFNPAFINVTYHREELVYKKMLNGLLKRKTVSKRPGTVAISAAIQHKYPDVQVVPHIICGGFTKEETENALIDLNFLGIQNLLAIRGDSLKNEKRFVSEDGGHSFSIDLVHQIVEMNKGSYIDEELQNTTPTNFSIGVAGYPEKHIEAPNLSYDLKHLKAKVDAGADYVVTQLFFDNHKYFDFVKSCREIGITVPIIPGLKPISNLTHLRILPQTFNIDLPEELVKEVEKCKTNRAVNEVGVEWAVQQSKELVEYGCPVLHFYTMGKAQNVCKIAKEIF